MRIPGRADHAETDRHAQAMAEERERVEHVESLGFTFGNVADPLTGWACTTCGCVVSGSFLQVHRDRCQS